MWKWGIVGLLAVLVAGIAVAQYTTKPDSIVTNFENGLQVGGSTRITGAAGTGDAAFVPPVNSVGLGSDVSGFGTNVTFCGDLVNASTTYLGPGLAAFNGTPTDYVIAGTACNALDSATEATADAPLSTLAVKVNGFRCKQSAASGAGETSTYTLRTAAANAVTTDGGGTTVSCAISGATATECRSVAGTTVNIAAGATVAMQVVSTHDASTQDAACVALVSWP